MKKRGFVEFVFTLLLAVSCGKDVPITSSSSSSSSQSMITEISEQEVLSILEDLKNGNFTMSYTFANQEFKDVYTSSYFYIGYLNNGSVLLNAMEDKTYAYDFQIMEGDIVELKGQTFNEEQTFQNLTSLSFKNQMKDLNTTGATFERKEGKLYTRHQDIIEKLSAQLDFSSGISQISFYKTNENLTFDLYVWDGVNEDYYIPEGGHVLVLDVGHASLPCVDAFLKDWKVPQITLEGKADNLFGNVSFQSAINDFSLDLNKVIPHGFSNVDIYNQFIRVTTINEEDVPYQETYQRIGTDTLNYIGVNGKNEVVNQESTKKYSDFRFIGKEGFELSNFRKVSEEDRYYLYLGSNAQRLAYSITQSSIFSRYPCLKIQVEVEENQVKSLHFFTGIMQDRDTGDFFYYRIDTEVLKTPNVIEGAEKKTPSQDDAKIRSYLDTILNSNFSIEAVDSAWEGSRKTFIFKTETLYLKQTFIMNGEEKETLESGSGFYVNQNRTYSFRQNGDGTIQILGYTEQDLLTMMNFSISSEILFMRDNAIYTTGDIIDLGGALGIISNPLFIDPSSLKMEIANEKIATLSYTYGGSGFSGNEVLTFQYATPTVDEALLSALEKATNGKTRETWADYISKVPYEAMVEYFGEEVANKIPYLADPLFIEFGFDAFEYDTNDFRVCSSATDNGYIAKYKTYLLEIGYTTHDNTTFVCEADRLQIIVGESLDDFLKISLL